jgi:hypothetical protein
VAEYVAILNVPFAFPRRRLQFSRDPVDRQGHAMVIPLDDLGRVQQLFRKLLKLVNQGSW